MVATLARVRTTHVLANVATRSPERGDSIPRTWRLSLGHDLLRVAWVRPSFCFRKLFNSRQVRVARAIGVSLEVSG